MASLLPEADAMGNSNGTPAADNEQQAPASGSTHASPRAARLDTAVSDVPAVPDAAVAAAAPAVDGYNSDGGVWPYNPADYESQGRGSNSDATTAAPTTEDPVQQGTAKTGGAEVASILNTLTTSVGVEAELQCTLCHEILCKPVTTPCGHSFCRVCLVEFLLSREVHETHCPICRSLVLPKSIHEGEIDAPVFSINVTLWNVIQLLVPALREQDAKDEEDDYALKYDQFDAKWRMAALRQSAERANPRRRRRAGDDEDDEDQDSGDEENPIYLDDSDADDHSSDDEHQEGDREHARRRVRYPELRREGGVDGHLELSRNVVLDRDDANEDGYQAMRVGLALMEFPSLFQLYNEHQECSIAILKLEEDEDMDSGIPFFTSDNGDDDELIMGDYYNEVTLRVLDEADNVVMERTRGATQGIVIFPALRLDVPGGMYRFHFTDDLYGVEFTIRTELREPHEENDDLLGEQEQREPRHGAFVLDQAGERGRGRRGRGRRQSDDDEDDEEEEDDDDGASRSDDSFIVNDDDELDDHRVDEAHFSGSDDGSEEMWDQEDEEEAMEREERQRQQQMLRRLAMDSRLIGSDDFEEEEEDHDAEQVELSQEPDGDADQLNRVPSQSDPEPEEPMSPFASRTSRKRARIVDDDSESDGGESHASEANESAQAQAQAQTQASHRVSDQPSAESQRSGSGKKRSRAIYESDDDDDDEDDGEDDDQTPANQAEGREAARGTTSQGQGFSSNKRLRQVTARIFHDEDEDDDDEQEHEEDDDRDLEQVGVSAGRVADNAEGDVLQRLQSRWIGSDPYESESAMDHHVETEDYASDEDDSIPTMSDARVIHANAVYSDEEEEEEEEDHDDRDGHGDLGDDGSEASEAEPWDQGDHEDDDHDQDDEEEFSD